MTVSVPTRASGTVLWFLIAVLAAILLGTTASASAAGVVENRDGAISHTIEPAVGPPQHIAAGQSRDATLQQPQIVVATGVAAETAALDATTGGRGYSAHYLNDTGPVRNIPGSMVDETIDNGQVLKDLADRTVYYDPKNDVTVVPSKTTGKVMSVRRGMP